LYYTDQSKMLDSSLDTKAANDLVLARYWQSQNVYDVSLVHWQRAYDNAEFTGNNRQMAEAYSGMASAYFSQDPEMKKVMEYLRKSNARCDSSKHANILARNHARMANACMVLGRTADAEAYLNRAKKIVDISGNLPVKSYILASFAILKAEQGNIAEAVQFAEEPIRIKRELGQLRQLQNDLLNISEWYLSLEQYDKSRLTLTEGIQASRALGDVVYLQYFYDRFSLLDSLSGNYRAAYANLKRSMFYKDSAQSLKRFAAVEEIREKYAAEQNEKIIAEKEIVIQGQRYQQAIITSASVIAVLVMIVFLIVIRNRHRLRLQLEKQRQSHMRLQTIVHTQEEVQQSIARDIHDGLVQVLGAAKMSLQSVDHNSDRIALMNRILEASHIMDDAVEEARNISHQVLPYSLMKDGLGPALRELLRKSLVNCDSKIPDEMQRLHKDVEINIYRIAQELVNNITKHAEAEHVSVELTIQQHLLTLAFRDDGRGFDVTCRKEGAGLTNIFTRMELLGGQAEIKSIPGEGTFVKLQVPI
jgi:two-component system, NarL family, sensor kinase